MQPVTRPARRRLLRLAIGAPAAVLGGVILSFAIGTSAASADEAPAPGLLSSVVDGTTNLVTDVVKDTTTTVTQVTHSTTKVVTSVVKPEKKKPVTNIVKTVVAVIPATTTSVTDTAENLVDNTVDLLDNTTDAVLPELPEVPVVIDPAVVVPVATPVVESATSTPALSTATVTPTVVAATPATETAQTAGIPAVQVSPLTPELLVFSPEPTAYAGSAGGAAPVSATTSGGAFAPVSAASITTPENDVLPSTPTFDTDTSPD